MDSLIRAVDRLRRMSVRRLGLVVEAALSLLLARLAIKLFPFRLLVWYCNRHSKKHEVIGPERDHLRMEVSRAIDRAASILPGKTVCFPRGIVAQSMLRRRGVGTTLYYGAATLPEVGLTSHVWVRDGEEGVVGHSNSANYQILAHYP